MPVPEDKSGYSDSGCIWCAWFLFFLSLVFILFISGEL